MLRIRVLRIACAAFIACLSLPTAYGKITAVLDDPRVVAEDRLLDDLIIKPGYNPLIRPVKNISDVVVVKFSLELFQLISVDELKQIMKVNVWLQLYWTDYQLKWNIHDYERVMEIRIDSDRVWTPDVVLFNNADGNYEPSYKSKVVLGYEGDHYWIPPAIYKTTCALDVKYFPYDEQECQLKFSSWTYKVDQFKFKPCKGPMVGINDYVKSGTWDIVELRGDREDHNERNQIVITFRIRRKTLFYTINLILPCVLLTFVSVCVFALPSDAGEKMTLCISSLLALVVFMLLVAKILPPSLTIPLIAKYLLFTFIMNVLAIMITVIIINRNYRTPGTHRMPQWVRVVFLNYLPRILLIKRPGHDEKWKKEKTTDSKQISLAGNDMLEFTEVHNKTCNHVPKQIPVDYANRVPPLKNWHNPLSDTLVKVTEAVKIITQLIKTQDDFDAVTEDWKYLAIVLDHLLFYVFLFVTIGGTVGIITEAPHIFNNIDQDTILEYMRKRQSEAIPNSCL